MKSVLVTGGCGFIGSNFLNHMMAKYPDITFINIDAMYYCASLENVEKRDNYVFYQGKIQDQNLVFDILQRHVVDSVVHFAAQTHVQNSFDRPIRFTEDNVLGTHVLLETCRLYGKLERFIHVSTDEVYGESLIEDQKDEESVVCPNNPYAATKASAELLVFSYIKTFQFPAIVTRGNNVFGPRQYPEKVIPSFITRLLKNEKCLIQGTGECRRNFIYVDDVCSAFEILLQKGRIGEVYNIAGETEHSVLELAKILIEKLGKNDANSWIEYIQDRAHNDKRYYISNDKLKELGWRPTIPFELGIEKTISWYKN